MTFHEPITVIPEEIYVLDHNDIEFDIDMNKNTIQSVLCRY